MGWVFDAFKWDSFKYLLIIFVIDFFRLISYPVLSDLWTVPRWRGGGGGGCVWPELGGEVDSSELSFSFSTLMAKPDLFRQGNYSQFQKFRPHLHWLEKLDHLSLHFPPSFLKTWYLHLIFCPWLDAGFWVAWIKMLIKCVLVKMLSNNRELSNLELSF